MNLSKKMLGSAAKKSAFGGQKLLERRYKALLFSVVTLAMSSTASAGFVKSLSKKTYNDGAQPFWEVSVNCRNNDTPYTIRKQAKRKRWCAELLPTLCTGNKYSLSRKVCSRSFEKKLKAFRASESESAAQIKELAESSARDSRESALQQEKLKIEEQRILIRKRQLELEKRELELKKSQQLGS